MTETVLTGKDTARSVWAMFAFKDSWQVAAGKGR